MDLIEGINQSSDTIVLSKLFLHGPDNTVIILNTWWKQFAIVESWQNMN